MPFCFLAAAGNLCAFAVGFAAAAGGVSGLLPHRFAPPTAAAAAAAASADAAESRDPSNKTSRKEEKNQADVLLLRHPSLLLLFRTPRLLTIDALVERYVTLVGTFIGASASRRARGSKEERRREPKGDGINVFPVKQRQPQHGALKISEISRSPVSFNSSFWHLIGQNLRACASPQPESLKFGVRLDVALDVGQQSGQLHPPYSNFNFPPKCRIRFFCLLPSQPRATQVAKA